MKISAKDREDAETLCLLRADVCAESELMNQFSDPSLAIGASRTSIRLASAAWFACFYFAAMAVYGQERRRWSVADVELEAAALIRDGWCPGDPVVRLGR